MDYYTLTVDVDEDSENDDPSWFVCTSNKSANLNSQNPQQPAVNCPNQAVGCQAPAVEPSSTPLPTTSLQDAVRNCVSAETFHDFVKSAEKQEEENSSGKVVLRRKNSQQSGGRRASQRFSRIFEGVANYVIGSVSSHQESANLPTSSSSSSPSPTAHKSSKPHSKSAKSNSGVNPRNCGGGVETSPTSCSGYNTEDDEVDTVPCWDPNFPDARRRKSSQVDRRQSVPYWIEANIIDQSCSNISPSKSEPATGAICQSIDPSCQAASPSCHADAASEQSLDSGVSTRDSEISERSTRDNEISERISEIFTSFNLQEESEHQTTVVRETDQGFFKRRKNIVSGYFHDWANTFGLIESDAKSLNSLSTQTSQNGPPSSGHGSQSGHSRKSSDTSQISVNSGSSCPEGGEEDLWSLWGKIINEWDTFGKKKLPTIKDLVRKGIPHHFRGIAWQVLCGAHESTEKAKYSEYMKTTSACEKVIRRDIARTYPEHDFFKKKDGVGQEALFNVMKAYSIHDREVGYCQGSAFIVGLLLMQMPEEESFAVLVKIMQDYRMREMFKPSMAELGLCMYQMDTLVQEHCPELYVHFQSQAIHTNLYASSWFLTLFTTTLPITLSCRIMDCFLSEGIEVIFRLALTLLITAKHELLSQDMEGVLKYFQKEMPAKFEADPEIIFSMAFNIKINQKKMKRLEKEYNTMKCKEKEDEIELRRLRTENRLLRQRIDTLENESSELADRLIQGQVNRAEVEETTFAIKRELAAIRQHDLDTNGKLEEAKERIRKLSSMLEDQSKPSSLEDMSLKSEIIKQKEEMINCLQDELIKVRLREAENEETIKKQREKISELEEEGRRSRENVPEAGVASLQEELAASKLREAEANLALKDLRAKVGELNQMWQKHLKRAEAPKDPAEVPSTPKKLLGSLLEGKSEAGRLEEELMSSRLKEVEAMAELKELRLKVMDLETQREVWNNQVKRQGEEGKRLQEQLDAANKNMMDLNAQLRESQRRFGDLEGKLKEDLMMARIRDAENTQCVAELTQKISNLEYKNQELVTEGDLSTSIDESDRVRELQDKVACLRAQVTRLALMNSKLTQSLSMHNLATSFGSDSDTSVSTPRQSPGTSPSRSSLALDLGSLSFSTLSLNRTLSNS